MKRREYYKAEIVRVVLYPFLFMVVALIFTLFGFSIAGENMFDPEYLKIYFGVAILSTITSLILYLFTYKKVR